MYSIPSIPRSVSDPHSSWPLLQTSAAGPESGQNGLPCPHTTHTHPAPYPCPLQGRPEKLSMLVSCGCHVKAPKLGGWNNRNEFFPQSGGQMSESRCRRPVPPGGTLSRACCGSQAAQGLACGRPLHSASPCPPLHSGLPTFPHQAPLSDFEPTLTQDDPLLRIHLLNKSHLRLGIRM